MYYSEGTPFDKMALILDYFFQYPTDYIRPVTILKELDIKHDEKRTFYKYCQKLKDCLIIESSNPIGYIDNAKDTEYRLTTDEVVKFNIPIAGKKRFNYADAIVTLLVGKNIQITNERLSLPLVNSTIYSLVLGFGNGILRDSFLAAAIYDYFKFSQGSLLTILLELAQYNQLIEIDIQSEDTSSKIKNTTIKGLSLNEDDTIELQLANSTVTLSSLNNIVNIFLISDNFPNLNPNMSIPVINTAMLLEAYKKHINKSKMKEEFVNITKELEKTTIQNHSSIYDEVTEKMIREKIEGMTLSERAKRRIKKK